ncbi:TetR/AcrR family transcriptional regulator [Amnibacterium flavum]|nr:TetR/AcrR family transcriptional regulator [Amnibacterium flavum]
MSVRDRRMEQTRRSITNVTRAMTAEHGLHGFTVDQVCDEVGVSRRTFFNYFRTKEDAIVGADNAAVEIEEAVAFLDARDAERGATSPVDYLAELAIHQVSAIGLTPQQAAGFIAALEKEPQLLERLMKSGSERERELTGLVAAREGFEPADVRAQAAVAIANSVIRIAMGRFVAPGNTRSFDSLLGDALVAARAVFPPAAPSSANNPGA